MASRNQASEAPAEGLLSRWGRAGAIGVLLTLAVLASRQPGWSHSSPSDALEWPAAAVVLLAGMALAAGVVMLVAVIWWLSPWRRRGDPADPPRVPHRVRLGVRGWASLAGVALLAIAGRRRSLRHRAIGPSPPLRGSGSPAVAARWPADPRLAAFAAYRHAEASLSAAGEPRDAAEGPRDYLERVAVRLGGAELRELTTIYEKARFSPHAVGAPERARAVAAVRRLEVRVAADAQPSARRSGER